MNGLLFFSDAELEVRDRVLKVLVESIERNQMICLPKFNVSFEHEASAFAMSRIGIENNPYSGEAREYRYQFEGEEDLLHMIVTHKEGNEISPEEGRYIADFVLASLPKGVIWFKPGEFSQHFYFGHDDLLKSYKENRIEKTIKVQEKKSNFVVF